jgi:hypothetical protein
MKEELLSRPEEHRADVLTVPRRECGAERARAYFYILRNSQEVD